MNSKRLMLQMDAWPDGSCPEKKPRPLTSGGTACAVKGSAKRFEIKKKERGIAIAAIKSRIVARKRAYAQGKKSG